MYQRKNLELFFNTCLIVFVVQVTVFLPKWFKFFSMRGIVGFKGNIMCLFIGLICDLGCFF